MVCPKEDKLLDYVEGFLDDEEKATLERHLHSCPYCAQQIEFLIKENEFLGETLKSPMLPDDFAEKMVEELQPYKRKKHRPLKWVFGTAASVLLAGGIMLSVNPGFAKLLGGIFTSDRVDEGLQIAADTDIATPVNRSVTDQGITLYVEDLIADTSRIALSYRVTNKNGKTLDPYVDLNPDSFKLIDEHNKVMENLSMSWGSYDEEYGVFEFSLVDIDEPYKKGTIQIELNHLAGKDGHWKMEIPVDLTTAFGHQKVANLDTSVEMEGANLRLNKVNSSTSTTDIYYTIGYTDEAKEKLKQQMKEKEKKFGRKIVQSFLYDYLSIGYRIEDSNGNILGYENVYAEEDKGHPVSKNMLSGSGRFEGNPNNFAPISKIDSFTPQKNEGQLYFVLDTIYMPKFSDFSITFKPDELPKTFKYKGYELTIKSVKVNSKKNVEIEMSGFVAPKSPHLVDWVIEDKEGKMHEITSKSESVSDEKDEQGRFQYSIIMSPDALKKVPDEMTLHLIGEKEVKELEQEWRVPLFK